MLFGAFKDVPGALTLKGVPVYAAITPFTCQPPRISDNTPDCASLLPFPNGSSYSQPACSTCVRSKPAVARLRRKIEAQFHPKLTEPSSSTRSIDLENVYAPCTISPFAKDRFTDTCSEW